MSADTQIALYAMDCGRLLVKDADGYADDGSFKGLTRDMVDPCYLIDHPKGKLLWDGGLPETLAASPERISIRGFVLSMPKTLTSQLAELGLTPADIDFFSMSHCHIDHIGNADLLKGATFLVDARERAYMFRADVRKTNLEFVSYEPLDVAKTHSMLELAKAYSALELAKAYSALETAKTIEIPPTETYDVFGDGSIVIYPAPGHTPGHRVLLLRLPQAGPVLLTGDMYHLAESREKRSVPRFNDRAQTLASFDAVEKLAADTGARVVRQHVLEDFLSLPAFPKALR